jgi:hypothetical protein
MRGNMKNITLALTALIFSLSVAAGELTGAGARALLVRSGIDPQGLEQSGARILAGELTGAGRTLDLGRIQYFMTNKEVFEMGEVRHVELNVRAERTERDGRLNRAKLGDVKFLEINAQKVPLQSIQGLVVK